MKKYAVKEVYYTVQGEAGQSGRAAVFVRFAGCNLWSGTESARVSAICQFCDTDFVGTDGPNGGRYTADELCEVVLSEFPPGNRHARLIVMTGGEPTLQVDRDLVDRLKMHTGALIAIETNGTHPTPDRVDWICVSPKGTSLRDIVQTTGSELKLVYPQDDCTPEEVQTWAIGHGWDFERWYLQPKEVPDADEWAANVQATIQYVKENPRWRLSLQTHKMVGIP